MTDFSSFDAVWKRVTGASGTEKKGEKEEQRDRRISIKAAHKSAATRFLPDR